MKDELINKIPFREKKLIVSETLLLYSKMKKLRETENFSNAASDVVSKSIASNIRGASIVETILSVLPAEQSLILENDFLKKSNSNWYVPNWAKGTYYKLKHEAIDQFIYLLYA